MAVKAAADTLGIPADSVRFHEMLLGGAFGRRGPRDEDSFFPRSCFRARSRSRLK